MKIVGISSSLERSLINSSEINLSTLAGSKRDKSGTPFISYPDKNNKEVMLLISVIFSIEHSKLAGIIWFSEGLIVSFKRQKALHISPPDGLSGSYIGLSSLMSTSGCPIESFKAKETFIGMA